MQRDNEWLAIRMGRFTGSEIYKIMTDPRTKAEKEAGAISKTAEGYILDNIAEQLTLTTPMGFSSESMERGIQLEQEARFYYEVQTGQKVYEVDFIEYGDHGGVSPDGLVGDDGGLELKCPDNNAIHLKYFRLKTAEDLKNEKKEYYWQVLYNLLCTGRKWWDFVSYSDRFPAHLRMKILRIEASQVQDDIKELAERIDKAIEAKNDLILEFI